MAKQVAINDLKPGMFIVGVIEQNGPVKIRKSGLVTSHEMVQGLMEMGVISLAIDPEKTVEIEVDDEVHVSQTQFVMQANEEKASVDTDNHLAEQFNRSLFMPSLQKVPSVWQYYGSKIAVGLLVVVLGLTTGWFAATLPTLLTKNIVITDSPGSTQHGATTNNPDVEPDESEKVLTNSDADSGDSSSNPITNEAETPLIAEASSEPETIADADSNQTMNNLPQTNSLSDSQITPSATDTVDSVSGPQTVTQLGAGESQSVVSPELLQRFEAAMADLERESSPDFSEEDTLEYGDPENGFNNTDVQRVDQLPARVMTRLPRMSFSAHMYTTNPRDRWVKVNGIEMGEGEWLDDKIFIEKIEPQHVILLFEGHQFSMRALSEW